MVVHGIDTCAGTLNRFFPVASRVFGTNSFHRSEAQEAAKQGSPVAYFSWLSLLPRRL